MAVDSVFDGSVMHHLMIVLTLALTAIVLAIIALFLAFNVIYKNDSPECVQAEVFYDSPEGVFRIGEQERCNGEWSNIYGPSFEARIKRLERDLEECRALVAAGSLCDTGSVGTGG